MTGVLVIQTPGGSLAQAVRDDNLCQLMAGLVDLMSADFAANCTAYVVPDTHDARTAGRKD